MDITGAMNIDQYFRFIWLHSAEWVGNTHLAYTLLAVMAVGAVISSRILRPGSCPLPRDGYVAAMVVGLTFVTGVALLALIPTSPLLSISGGIEDSPWLAGLFPVMMIIIVITSLVYGLVSGALSSWRDVVDFLCYGFKKWPWLVLLGMIW